MHYEFCLLSIYLGCSDLLGLPPCSPFSGASPDIGTAVEDIPPNPSLPGKARVLLLDHSSGQCLASEKAEWQFY